VSRPRRYALLLCLAVLTGIPCAAAQTPQKKLEDVEQQLEQSRQHQGELAKQAESLGTQLQALRADEVKAAAAAQTHETALTRLEAERAGLVAAERAKSTMLAHDRASEERLLLAMARLAREPPVALVLGPTPPVDALRGGILMGRAIPPLETRARALGSDVARLKALRASISSVEAKHRAERQGLAQERTRIAALIARMQGLQQQTQQQADEAARRQRALASRATDLKDLIARLEVAPPAPKGEAALALAAPVPIPPDSARPGNIRPISQAKGRMDVPASGLLVVRFGDPEPAGTSKGLTFETRPGAQVVAPYDGKVEYAGPFKGYGQILIIGHGDGYHSLLAGLDRVDQLVGQWLVAGEPVGVMAQGDRKPRLYLELRYKGQPINPLPWLAIRDEKVN
jgi:murein hydrolase activator